MVNIVGPAFSGVFAVIAKPRITGEYSSVNKFDIGTFCNGIIVGLASVTASCNNIDVWASPIITLIAVTTYSFAVKFYNTIHVDDPVEAGPLHLSAGIIGTLAVAFFDKNVGLLTGHMDGFR